MRARARVYRALQDNRLVAFSGAHETFGTWIIGAKARRHPSDRDYFSEDLEIDASLCGILYETRWFTRDPPSWWSHPSALTARGRSAQGDVALPFVARVAFTFVFYCRRRWQGWHVIPVSINRAYYSPIAEIYVSPTRATCVGQRATFGIGASCLAPIRRRMIRYNGSIMPSLACRSPLSDRWE